MNTYLFTKEMGNWYINFDNGLKEFNNSDLVLLEESVQLLDFLSNEKKKVSLSFDTNSFEKAYTLELINMCEGPEGGGYYQLKDHRGRILRQELWLSDIPLFVFGDIPDQIYLRREKCFSIQPVGVE